MGSLAEGLKSRETGHKGGKSRRGHKRKRGFRGDKLGIRGEEGIIRGKGRRRKRKKREIFNNRRQKIGKIYKKGRKGSET